MIRRLRQARYRMDLVSPEPACTPLRLSEPARRMAELTRENVDAFVDRHLLLLLDGSRDRHALLGALLIVVGRALIRIDLDDGGVPTEEGVRGCACAVDPTRCLNAYNRRRA